jgi:hypothetical protein
MQLVSYSHWDWLASLPKEPSCPPKFNVNNIVTFTNDYGVEFKNKKIIKIEFITGEWRYYLTPSACPWFPSYERQLAQELNIDSI